MIYKVLLLALACSSLASALTCDSLKDFYKCNESNEKLVNIGGVDYSCKDGFVCNAKYRVVESLCSACVDITQVCDKTAFTCVDEKTFKVGKSEFKCLNDATCNTSLTTTCKPCIEKVCEKYWKCEDGNVIIGGGTLTCGKGEKCNEAEHPTVAECQPCIPE